ncbi:MAG: M28 family peptidase [Candidatus Zixiibacteriota bacterium]|nr:MAG: M28 family peptidase [candidate division Zixibacteria bacterium]
MILSVRRIWKEGDVASFGRVEVTLNALIKMSLNRKETVLVGLLTSVVVAFGCTSSPPPQFDGQRAFANLLNQCRFGPRNPGSVGHREAREYFLDKLSEQTSFVKVQDFVHLDREEGVELKLSNIIASFNPEKAKRMLLCAHWDTRPFADHDPDTALWAEPILGANDGASGVAVLLEIARIISHNEPLLGVDIVLFDGEDGGNAGDLEGFCLGSKHFARVKGDYQPEFGILLDMIGDKDLALYKEAYSATNAKELTDSVWSRAREMGLLCFRDSVKYAVYDDHVPLLGAGIRVISLIDFDYPYWHTTSDTPDKCSPESLQKIGDLLVHILYNGI